MTTSGTVGQTVVTTAEFIEQALTMCGVRSAMMTPETVRKAKLALFMYLSALANDGVNLWTIEHTVFGVVPGTEIYKLPVGSIDEQGVYYRKADYANEAANFTSSAGGDVENLIDGDVDTTFVQSSANGSIEYDFETPKRVEYFGLMAYNDIQLSRCRKYRVR